MGGFCEVLQGSNSLARGFIVLSGTQQLLPTMRAPKFAAVFRRIAVTTLLGPLSVDDIRTFFQCFIHDFVPSCRPEELQAWARRFTQRQETWGGCSVSIDMVKQFLMNRISNFRAVELPDIILHPDVPWHVPADHWQQLIEHLCDEPAASHFLDQYPSVNDIA